MAVYIEVVSDDIDQRKRTVRFLSTFEGEDRSAEFWAARMEHWWSNNPFCKPDSPRGLILRDGDAVVGFQGLIPQEYVLGETVYPALGSTTWRVDSAYRNSALGMFMRMQRLSQTYMLVDCTPNAEVRAILERVGYQRRDEAVSVFLPVKRSSHLVDIGLRAVRLRRKTKIALRGNQCVASDDEWDLNQLGPTGSLCKRVTPEAVRWYMSADGGGKYFRGLRSPDGKLLAYVIAVSQVCKGLPTLEVIEYGCEDEEGLALCALLEQMASLPHACGVPDEIRLISIVSFESEPWLERFPVCRPRAAHHYFHMPPSWSPMQKYVIMAEGDFGL